LLGYSLQIYLDFSGYSDIAVGSSRLFGVTVRENFDWPYLQPDIGKFWRHWHISLSDWIRDYLFFPLSRMSEKRMWRTVGVPLAAMALCGLWHGAAWHFVIWGLWHGAGLAVMQNWRGRKLLPGGSSTRTADRARTIFATVATFAFVTIGWLWFR
jgi:alginate O-acetyltransferase complex protein AlgI